MNTGDRGPGPHGDNKAELPKPSAASAALDRMQAHHKGLANGGRDGIAQGPKATPTAVGPDPGHRVAWKQDFRQIGPPPRPRTRLAAKPPWACAPGSEDEFRLFEDPTCDQVPRPQSKCNCPDNPTGMSGRTERCRTMEPEGERRLRSRGGARAVKMDDSRETATSPCSTIACGLHRSMTEAGIHLQQMLPLCNTRCCNSTSTNQALHLASNRDGHRLGEASCMKTAI